MTQPAPSPVPGDGLPAASQRYRQAARAFADAILQHGRDTYGATPTPLFVDGLNVDDLSPVTWLTPTGETWVLSNLASQQPFMRLLDGLTAWLGEPRYRQAAEATTAYALEHLRAPNGLLNWGGHGAWDLRTGRPANINPEAPVHELHFHQPYFALMWRVHPDATRRLLGSIWAGHIADWSLLDFNRHAPLGQPLPAPPWDHAFDESMAVPFPAVGMNLSFCLAVPSLLHSGTMLAVLGRHDPALTWVRRLVFQWQQARHPRTGLCGGQLSYRVNDRAQQVLGHVHPTINEAQFVATYHQIGRYHLLPLAQMQAAESLIAAGGPGAAVGREFIAWASADLKVYRDFCYDEKQGLFIPMLTDGTPLAWQQAKPGCYYKREMLAPRRPDGWIFWAYALAYRLTGDPAHWQTLSQLAPQLGLGALPPRGTQTPATDWALIYGLLEIHRATRDRAFLDLAAAVADNLLALQHPSGLFPRPSRRHARTGDEIPLALLHLAAACEGEGAALPPPILDDRYFHSVYGPLDPQAVDARTYDHVLFYGDYGP